jgi:hypothetical protein
MERDLRTMEWVYIPLITAIVGVVVGLVTRRAAARLAVLAAAPFSILFSLPGSGFSRGIGSLLLYLAAAAIAGWCGSRLAALLTRNRRSGADLNLP